MQRHPTVFEIIDDTGELAATVTQFDECAAEISIRTVQSTTSWEKLSAEIEKCIKAMLDPNQIHHQ